MIAVILASARLERLYTGLSLLVSAAAEGRPRTGWPPSPRCPAARRAADGPRAAAGGDARASREPGRAVFARTLARAARHRRRARGVPAVGLRRGRRDHRRRTRRRSTRASTACSRRRASCARSRARSWWRCEARGAHGRRRARRRRCSPRAAARRRPDLFEVTRSGADRNANVRLLVSDGGTVTLQRQGAHARRRAPPRRARARARPRAAGRAGPRAALGRRARSSPTACGSRRGRWPSATARADVPRTLQPASSPSPPT